MTRYMILIGPKIDKDVALSSLKSAGEIKIHGNGKNKISCTSLLFEKECIIVVYAHGYMISGSHIMDLCQENDSFLRAVSKYQKPMHFEIYSCHAGGILNDLTKVSLPDGSTIVTQVNAQSSSLFGVGRETLKRVDSLGSDNPYVRFICYFLNSPQETSIAIWTNSNTEVFQTHFSLHKKFNTQSILDWQNNTMMQYYEFLSKINNYTSSYGKINAAIDYLKNPLLTKDGIKFGTDFIASTVIVQELILVYAALQNDLNIVKKMLNLKINIKSNLILTHTVEDKYNTVVKELIQAGANVNQVDLEGNSPLMHASSRGGCKIINTLSKAGANVNAQNDDGYTSLILASQQGRTQIVDALIANGANVNQANNNFCTPLLLASQQGYIEVVFALIKASADIDKADKHGYTPTDMAIFYGHLDLLKILLKNGAKIKKFYRIENKKITDEISEYNKSPTKYILKHHENVSAAIEVIEKINPIILPCLRIHGYEISIVGFCESSNNEL